MSSSSLWQRFQQYYLYYADLGFSLDISRMKFPDDFLEKMQPKVDKAFAAMRALEAGAIANPTEKRMVGHYWPRNPALSPTPEIRTEVTEANAFNIGALIALYERAVGFYASLVNINAYNQPGVEAGKKAATRLLELQKPEYGEAAF